MTLTRSLPGASVLAGTPRGRRPTASRSRRALAAFVGIALIVIGGGLGWAARVLLAPPPALPPGPSFVLIAATEDSVARSILLNARATWSGGRAVANVANGTVTRVRVSETDTLGIGDAVYDVDLHPVRVAEGEVPAFRTLSKGTQGDDVRQLQRFLRASGVSNLKADGRFGPKTARDVAAWQRELGEPATGEVALGRLLFVPRLPARVTVEGLTVGDTVTQGDPAPQANGTDEGASNGGGVGLRVLPTSPHFTILLPENQASLVRSGMVVRLTRGDSRWSARVEAVDAPQSDGSATARLSPPSNATSICGKECAEIPVAGDSGIRASIELVPRTEGIVVPTTALVVASDGSTAVVDRDGTRIPVEVRASSGGRAVVDGIDPGQEVRVPGDAQS